MVVASKVDTVLPGRRIPRRGTKKPGHERASHRGRWPCMCAVQD